MPVSSNGRVCGKICSALGLKNVVNIDISMHLNEPVKIKVEYYPDKEDLEKLIPLIEITTIGDTCKKYQKGE